MCEKSESWRTIMICSWLLLVLSPICLCYAWVQGPTDTHSLCPECGPCKRGWIVYNSFKQRLSFATVTESVEAWKRILFRFIQQLQNPLIFSWILPQGGENGIIFSWIVSCKSKMLWCHMMNGNLFKSNAVYNINHEKALKS